MLAGIQPWNYIGTKYNNPISDKTVLSHRNQLIGLQQISITSFSLMETFVSNGLLKSTPSPKYIPKSSIQSETSVSSVIYHKILEPVAQSAFTCPKSKFETWEQLTKSIQREGREFWMVFCLEGVNSLGEEFAWRNLG